VSYPSVDQRTLCENITYANPTLSTMLAVYSASSQILFKNQYCARCHGFTEATPIDMYVSCNLHMRNAMIDAAKTHGAVGVLNLLRDEALRADILDGSRVKFKFDLSTLPLLPSRYFCKKGQLVFHGCEHSHVDKLHEFVDSYRSPINLPCNHNHCHPLQIPWYVNWHWRKYNCFLTDSEELKCSEFPIYFDPYVWDDVLVVSASGVRYYNEHVFCPKEQIADVMSNACVEQPCQVRSRWIAGACHQVLTKTHPLPTPFTRAQLHVALVLSHAQPLEETLFQLSKYTLNIQHDTLPCSLLTDIHIDPPEAFCATLHIDVSVTEIFEALSHKDWRENFFDLVYKSVAGLSLIAILTFDPREALSCPHGAVAWYDNASILTEAVFPYFPAHTIDTVLVITSRESVTQGVEGVAVRLAWSVEESGDGRGAAYRRHSVRVGECREETNLATCRTTLLGPEEYTASTPTDAGPKTTQTSTKTTETTILSLSYSTLQLLIPTDHLIFADNNTLVICELTLKHALEAAAAEARARSSPNAGETVTFALWLHGIPLLLTTYLY
jgi:hypothetical protein